MSWVSPRFSLVNTTLYWSLIGQHNTKLLSDWSGWCGSDISSCDEQCGQFSLIFQLTDRQAGFSNRKFLTTILPCFQELLECSYPTRMWRERDSEGSVDLHIDQLLSRHSSGCSVQKYLRALVSIVTIQVGVQSPSQESSLNSRTWTWSDSILLCYAMLYTYN